MLKISNFIKPGVIDSKKIIKIFKLAKNYNFAIPAVNCIGTDSINAVLETASKVSSPVIIQFSYEGSKFIAGKGLDNNISQKQSIHDSAIYGAISGANHVHKVAKLYNIPVILNTDHCGKNLLPWLDELLNIGEKKYYKTGKPLFSSHMIDLSKESIEYNIKICSEYLKRMSKINMILEIELGCTGGEEDGVDNSKIKDSLLYTTPEEINYAWEKLSEISSNFIIAANFGNTHGVYKTGNVRLNPKILYHAQKYISKKHHLPINHLNFVFHGGSGSSKKDIQEAISYGVVKMNIDTDVQWAFWCGVLKFYEKNKIYLHTQLGNVHTNDQPNKKYYDPRVWLRCAQKSTIIRLEKTFKILNSINIF